MYEDIFAAVIRLNESITLLAVEPLNNTCRHKLSSRVNAAALLHVVHKKKRAINQGWKAQPRCDQQIKPHALPRFAMDSPDWALNRVGKLAGNGPGPRARTRFDLNALLHQASTASILQVQGFRQCVCRHNAATVGSSNIRFQQ